MKLFRIDLKIRLGEMVRRGDTYIVIAEDEDKAIERVMEEFDFYEWEFLDPEIIEINSINNYDIKITKRGES